MYAATSYELVLFTTQVSWSPTSSIAKAQQPSIRWCPIHYLSMATPATIPPQFWSLVPSSLCNLVPNHSWKHPTDCPTSWLWCFWEGGSKKQHSQRFNNLSHLVTTLRTLFNTTKQLEKTNKPLVDTKHPATKTGLLFLGRSISRVHRFSHQGTSLGLAPPASLVGFFDPCWYKKQLQINVGTWILTWVCVFQILSQGTLQIWKNLLSSVKLRLKD